MMTFDEGDRVVWAGNALAGNHRRGKVIDESGDNLTLVQYDDGSVAESVTDDLIHEAEYDRHLAAEQEHSAKAEANYLVYEITRATELRGFSSPRQIAACHGDSLAFTLDTLHEEGQIDDDARIGIMHRPDAKQPGTWLINPYAKGR